jgi:hypothetical protein
MHEQLESVLTRMQDICARHFATAQYARDSAYRSTEILNRVQKILPPKSQIGSIYIQYYPKGSWSDGLGELSIYARTAWGQTPKDLAPYLEKLERFLGECLSETNDDATELKFAFMNNFPMRIEPRRLKVSLNLVWQKPSDSTCQIVVTGYTTRSETQYIERQVPTYQIVCP